MNYLLSLLNGTVSAVKATPGWAGHALQVLIGSRFYVAVAATFFYSFVSQIFYAPTRFPPFVKINPLAFVGIAPDLGARPELPSEVQSRAQDVAQAGLSKAEVAAQAFFDSNPHYVQLANEIGLAVSGVALVIGLVLLSRQLAKEA